eukprot:TRINITY_DN3725_c0_g1_i5.p1 TRINITY_DN3725_c0_g1~~TRINITY_DN3725_c0_g1_i5.p1  ORF type:complete len:504 (+),score=28.51 TRINITY_DN3725_c0_g1_i5:17-1528(+)
MSGPDLGITSAPHSEFMKMEASIEWSTCIPSALLLNDSEWKKYRKGKALGRGASASVYEIIDIRSGETVAACKFVPQEKLQVPAVAREVHREILALQTLSGNEQVITLKGVHLNTDGLHMLLELCAGGTLLDFVNASEVLNEQTAANILRQLLLALKACHKAGIIHRDVKLENVLLTFCPHLASELSPSISSRSQAHNQEFTPPILPSIKLADFGLACITKNGTPGTGCYGSPLYMAPEILRSKQYGMEVDMWSAGVLLFAMISGHMPFTGPTETEIFVAILKGKPSMSSRNWTSISPEAKDIISRLLQIDPAQRITAEDALDHPWIQAHWEKTQASGVCTSSGCRLDAQPHPSSPDLRGSAVQLMPRWQMSRSSSKRQVAPCQDEPPVQSENLEGKNIELLSDAAASGFTTSCTTSLFSHGILRSKLSLNSSGHHINLQRALSAKNTLWCLRLKNLSRHEGKDEQSDGGDSPQQSVSSPKTQKTEKCSKYKLLRHQRRKSEI